MSDLPKRYNSQSCYKIKNFLQIYKVFWQDFDE